MGSGGQGIVFLSSRQGADGFTLPVAMKVFSPERFGSQAGYDDAMAFLPNTDALLLVTRESFTSRADTRAALALLEHRPLIGVVLNDCLDQPG